MPRISLVTQFLDKMISSKKEKLENFSPPDDVDMWMMLRKALLCFTRYLRPDPKWLKSLRK